MKRALAEGRPSVTAIVVAAARALAGVDPAASRLLPWPLGALETAPAGVASASLGLVEHIASRTLAIDAAVAVAAAQGVRQVVVLGAGFDARAFRLRGLAETTLFEVDHPATQRYKRARLADVAHAVRELRFVPVDFERDALSDALASAGHDAEAPTTWIWEGVTPYLPRSAVVETLDAVRARSAAGSVLILTYATSELGSMPRALKPFVLPAFRVLGEPLRGLLEPDDIEALVGARGFAVVDDVGIAELAPRFGRRAPRWTIAERLLVAKR